MDNIDLLVTLNQHERDSNNFNLSKETTMENFIIRKAVWGDLSNILKIKKQTHQIYVEKRPDIYVDSEILYTEHFLKSFFANDQKIILVALLDNEIVAYSFLECVHVQLPMMAERKYTYIHDFSVSEKYRRQGVATLMLKYIETYTIRKGVSKIELAVHLFSEEAVKLYEKNGFNSRAIRMEKELKPG